MDPKTKQALQDSIAHWERMRDAEDPARSDEGPEVEDCALCAVFFSDECRGCPVRVRTGQRLCRGTPYGRADAAWGALLLGGGQVPPWRAAAQEEIDFLKSLLPGDES